MRQFRNGLLLSCCLEAGDKRISITANPDTERQCTQAFHQTPPPPFPHKTSLVTSLSAKTSLLFNEGTRNRKSRTEKQRTRGGEIQEEMEE